MTDIQTALLDECELLMEIEQQAIAERLVKDVIGRVAGAVPTQLGRIVAV